MSLSTLQNIYLFIYSLSYITSLMHASKSCCILNPISSLCCSWRWVEWKCERSLLLV